MKNLKRFLVRSFIENIAEVNTYAQENSLQSNSRWVKNKETAKLENCFCSLCFLT